MNNTEKLEISFGYILIIKDFSKPDAGIEVVKELVRACKDTEVIIDRRIYKLKLVPKELDLLKEYITPTTNPEAYRGYMAGLNNARSQIKDIEVE